MRSIFGSLFALSALLLAITGCTGQEASSGPTAGLGKADGAASSDPSGGLKVLRVPMGTAGPKSLDPVQGSTVYDNRAACQVYETLLQYKYLKRPLELEPLLLEEMPTKSEDGLTFQFKLKKGVHFQDDDCFPGGKGRELVAGDVFYSWKRMADSDNSPKSWWLMENTIQGFDEYRQQQNEAETFDYDAPVEGFEIINDHEFRVKLKEPVQRFEWTLAMFQLAVVPREAVEHYGSKFSRHPVGTGPFTLDPDDWEVGKGIVFKKNPNYHASFYPDEAMPKDETAGLTAAAGTRLPIADRVEITFYEEPQPLWLDFRSGNIDYTTVPAENFDEAFIKRNMKLRPDFRREGITAFQVPLLDFIFFGFNMEDELLGGYTEEKKNLRRAISLALDWEERNDTFYNGTCVVYDGPIPPDLEGYPKDGKAPQSYRGPDLQRARELLAKAGYPDGEGLPVLDYYTGQGGQAQQQMEMTARQLKKIGVRLNPRLVDFATLIEAINNKKAPFFSFAWGSDYPDAENNLALFYGPNESPGANHFNYQRDDYDQLYEQIRPMRPSEERTKLYVQMRDMVIEDVPAIGSMARTRSYLVHPWLKNFKPTENFANWLKYLDLDESKRRK